jgi:predicted nuclease of predicted toxin-antitoxin system
MATAADAAILAATQAKQRILVTRDRDFGGLVFVQETGAGVVYLRITPSTQLAVHEELARVITSYTEEELRSSFVVVEPARHRIRRLGKKEQSE